MLYPVIPCYTRIKANLKIKEAIRSHVFGGREKSHVDLLYSMLYPVIPYVIPFHA